MLPGRGHDESGPEVFSPHGFSSQVRILAPRGKPGPGLEETLSGAPSRSDQAWLGGGQLPISDLQHVPHVLHFHHFMLQPDLQ